MLQRRTAVVRQRKNPPVGISNTAGSRTTSEIGLVAPLIPVGDVGTVQASRAVSRSLKGKSRANGLGWLRYYGYAW